MSHRVASDANLESFIGVTFRSVWALEVLCLLRKKGAEGSSANDLVASLRASDLIVDRSLDELIAAGLVSRDREGRASYAPATPELDRLAGQVEERYAHSPDAVRRVIVRASNPGASAFADAFRLGKKP